MKWLAPLFVLLIAVVISVRWYSKPQTPLVVDVPAMVETLSLIDSAPEVVESPSTPGLAVEWTEQLTGETIGSTSQREKIVADEEDLSGASISTLTVTVKGVANEDSRVFCKTSSGKLVGSSSVFTVLDTVRGPDGEPCVRLEISELPIEVPLVVQLKSTGGNSDYIDELLASKTVQLLPGESGKLAFDLRSWNSIQGLLVDTKGVGIPNQELVILKATPRPPEFFYWKSRAVSVAVTDGNGLFELANVEPGLWWVGTPREPHSQPDSAEPIARIAEQIEIHPGDGDRRITLIGYRGLYVHGKVIGPDDIGIPDIGVEGVTRDGISIYASSSDDGQFSLGPLNPGTLTLVSRKPVYGLANPEPVKVQVGDTDVVLQFLRGGTIRGMTLDEKLVPRAQVRLNLSRLDWADDDFEFRGGGSDQNCNFEFVGVSPGTYSITAITKDGLVGETEVELRSEGEEVRDVVLVLEPGATIRVRNERKESHSVVLVWRDQSLIARKIISGDDPVLGQWDKDALLTVPPGKLRVVIQSEYSELEQWVNVRAGELAELVLTDD